MAQLQTQLVTLPPMEHTSMKKLNSTRQLLPSRQKMGKKTPQTMWSNLTVILLWSRRTSRDHLCPKWVMPIPISSYLIVPTFTGRLVKPHWTQPNTHPWCTMEGIPKSALVPVYMSYLYPRYDQFVMTDSEDEGDVPEHCQVAFGAECAAILALACVVSFKGMDKQRNKKVQSSSWSQELCTWWWWWMISKVERVNYCFGLEN